VNEQNLQRGWAALEMGIALHTGEVVVGNIGSETRAKYGVVGSPVNMTARIESCTLGGQVFVAEASVQAAGPDLRLGSRMTIDAKGCKEPLAFYQLVGLGGTYNLSVPERGSELRRLAHEAPLHFTLIEGKQNQESVFSGRFVRLSLDGAEIASELAPEPLTNLRIRLTAADGAAVAGDLYAKVIERDKDGAWFRVGFTAVPPEVEAFLKSLLSPS